VERPWLKHYDAGVPPSLEYPRAPLYRLLDDAAARGPRRTAARFLGRRFSYGELKHASDALAFALRGLGIAPGDRVALLLPNAPPFIIAYYGILKAGAVVVPLNPLASADELAAQLSDCGAETLITIPLFAATAAALRERTPLRRLVVARLADYLPLPLRIPMTLREMRQLSAAKGARPLELRALIAANPPHGFAPAAADPGGLAVLLYSGGTTGAAKGIMLSHAACMANAHQLRAWGQLEASVAVLPLFHGYGMSVTMNAALLAGGAIVLVPRFNARDVLKTIQREKPTFFTGVPTMFVAFSGLPDLPRYNLSSLKGIFVGAAPLTAAIKEGFEARTGGRMIEGYGLTEAVTAIMANPYRGQHKLGSIGVPFPDVEMKIVSLDEGGDGTTLPPGELGEIVLRSPTLMLGYFNRPEATAAALRDGWLYTGDIGYMDEDGYFYITDRKKDLIIVGGFNVFPREVEELLYQHPAVREGVVLGVPDDYAGERVKAYVVLKEGASASEEEIISFLRERLTRYKVPSAVEFRAELPKTMIGKILRRALREEQPQERAGV
jgi:long-chain acyl-CoA synthetase